MRILDADAVRDALDPAGAVAAVTRALVDGLDPSAGPARSAVGLDHGEFLLMPAASARHAGIKVLTVSPSNPSRGLPRVQGTYLLHDAETLALQAVLDGEALTNLRTPAVSVAAVLPALARFDAPLRLAVLGAGPQALAHVDTLRACAPQGLGDVALLVRTAGRAGIGDRGREVVLGSDEAGAALATADVVVCATSARTPVLSAGDLAPRAVAVAVGSHEPDARELASDVLAGATVVVEDRATALREAGDVVLAVAEGSIRADDLVPMRDMVTGTTTPDPHRRLVFKSVGMPWQDLVVAAAVAGQ